MADLLETEKQVNSLRLARNTVSSKMHHCAASQKWPVAVPECFGVYLRRLRWRKLLVTRCLDQTAFPLQTERPCLLLRKHSTYSLAEPHAAFKKAKKSVFSLLRETPQRDCSCATLPRPNVSRQGKGNIVSLPCKAASSACGKPRSMAHTIANSQEYSFPSWMFSPV